MKNKEVRCPWPLVSVHWRDAFDGENGWTDIKDYKPRMVTRKNLMSGAEFQEDVNTPLCCSPASETFWSM